MMVDHSNIHILLVEDEALIAMMEQRQLKSYGYSVELALNGINAVQKALSPESPCDLILMDIDLGHGIDGPEAAARILKAIDIPIVFLSSHTEPEVVEKTEKITSYGYVVKNSGVVVLDAAIKMALRLFNEKMERKQTDEKLKESEERYRELVDTVNSGVAIYEVINDGRSGSDYIITDFNQFALQHEKIRKEEVIGRSLKDIRPNIDSYGLIDTFREVWLTGKSAYFPVKVYQDEKYFNYYENRVFKLPSGEIVAIYDDITERIQAEKSLKESEERFDLAMKATDDGIFDWNLETNEIYYSPGWKKMIGYEDHELSNDFSVWESTTEPEDVKKSWELQQKLISKKIDRFIVEFKMRHKDGHWVDILSRAKAIFNEEGKAVRIVGTHTDISDRKSAEMEIKKQLEEKETLLREVHHRMQNNISNIENLLSLQSDFIDHPEAKAALQESLTRVHSIRILYDKLLLGKEYHEISIRFYLNELLDSITAVYGQENDIALEKKIVDFPVDSKKAISLGIIINELVTNAFKYAFLGVDHGRLFISIEKNGDCVSCRVEDDGVGMMEGQTPGLGLSIVSTLVEQLGGTFLIKNNHGMKSSFQFGV